MADYVPNAELATLSGLFYRSTEQLGSFERISGKSVPPPYRQLLDHEGHMTVTLEDFHQSQVDVRVLETNINASRYARRILLNRQSDGRVVLFGIMRVNFDFLEPKPRQEIEAQGTPLGRVLIRHGILTQIEVVDLWKVTPGPSLCPLLGVTPQQTTYGRSAIIRCNGEPAVELLEIVAPEV